MTENEAITKQHIAQFILELADGGEMSAIERASASTAWVIWDSLKDAEMHPDMNDEKADEVLSQFPLGRDDELVAEALEPVRSDEVTQ